MRIVGIETKKMIDKALDLLSKNKGERKETLMEITKFLFTAFISSFVYKLVFGDFEILKFEDYEKLIPFFATGDFIKVSIIFIIIWHLFYYIIPFFFTFRATKKVNKIANFFKKKKEELLVDEQIHFPMKNAPPYFKKLINLLEKISYFSKNNGTWETGFAYHKLENFVGELADDKDDIDLSYFLDSIMVTLQFIIIYFGFIVINNSIPFWFTLLISIGIILYLAFIWIGIIVGLLIKVHCKPIKKFMEDIREKRIPLILV